MELYLYFPIRRYGIGFNDVSRDVERPDKIVVIMFVVAITHQRQSDLQNCKRILENCVYSILIYSIYTTN
jgi:hypothetical protein